MRLVRSLTITVSSLALAAAVGTTPSFHLHDSSTENHNVTTAVVNFGAPRTVTTAVVNFAAPQSLLIF